MNDRKNEHIDYALEHYNNTNNFADIKLLHNSIGKHNSKKINLSTTIAGKKFTYPLYINAMTGGTDKAFAINRTLAKIASQTGIMFCFGSISPLIKDKSQIAAYKKIISENKNLIFSLNIGADKKYAMVSNIVDELQPSFMQVHLNTLQELLMPEGDRDFTTIKSNIKDFLQKSSVSLIVKEVGFGMTAETIQELIDLGVKTVDISGRGGTNFALIENKRRKQPLDYLNDWGLTTLQSLLEAQGYTEQIDILASGGVHTALDIVKCLILGAKAVGMAGVVLKCLTDKGTEATIAYIEALKEEVRLIMTLLGAKNVKALKTVNYLVSGDTYNYCKQRSLI